MKVGILALQGAFREHAQAFTELGVEPLLVREPEQVAAIDALVLPGGESTTMSMLLESGELFEPVADRIADGLAVLGTCAGMILLATDVLDGRPDQRCFGAIDLVVRRNAFGRQVDSFEADLDVRDLPGGSFPAVFIRAPVVESAGAAVDVLATIDDRPVLCRQGAVTAAAFHPELSGDLRLHELFLKGA